MIVMFFISLVIVAVYAGVILAKQTKYKDAEFIGKMVVFFSLMFVFVTLILMGVRLWLKN